MPWTPSAKTDECNPVRQRLVSAVTVSARCLRRLAGVDIRREAKKQTREAKKQWEEQPKPVQMEIFGVSAPPKPVQMELRFDVRGITDELFWEEAEDRILDALQEYAEPL